MRLSCARVLFEPARRRERVMKRTLVLDVVGLTPALLVHAPNLKALAARGGLRSLTTVTPAVTTTVQSTLVTGAPPREHGVVGNGWYFRDLSEIWFWRQSNHLVGGEKVWDAAKRRDPSFTCAKLFWWYNMYASADFSVTPRPMYTADGRKLPDVYTHPAELRDELQRDLGQFPLFRFWGPTADIESTRWIGQSALRVFERHRPTLTLVYLPHLDYNLQRFGPNFPGIARDVAAVDEVCGELIAAAEREGAAGRGPVRVRHHRRIESDSREQGAAPSRLAPRARGAGPRTARSRRIRCLCRGRSPDRAHLRGATGARGRSRAAPAQPAGCRAGAGRGRQTRDRSGSSALGRAGCDIRRAQLVHVLPLPRRRPGAGLCAHRRHSPQAGLRPGRALRRPRSSGCRNCESPPAWHRSSLACAT